MAGKFIEGGLLREPVIATASSLRRVRFLFLERVVLPVAIWPLRAWLWSCRRRGPDPATLAHIAARPRVVFTMFHGTLFEGLAHLQMLRPHGRRWIIFATPSRDGRLAAALLERLGARCAFAARDFIHRVAAGDVGLILADGPLGPRGCIHPGVARTIAIARADVVALGFAASSGIRFNSWDRPRVPTPFARVQACVRMLPPAAERTAYDAAAIRRALESADAQAQRVVEHGG